MPPFGIPIENYSTEIIYSFVIILCSLLIFVGTKKLYELSSHKGIQYLRESFLFFAIAFFFGSFIKIFFTLSNSSMLRGMSQIIFQSLSLFIFIYFSSIAVFYLIYSMMWKRWNGHSKKIWLFHVLGFLISTISILLNSARIYFLINFLILIFILLSLYFVRHDSKKQKKKKTDIYAVYILLFVFWMLNVIDVLIPKFFEEIQLIIYLASIGIFMAVLYKVLKKSGAN